MKPTTDSVVNPFLDNDDDDDDRNDHKNDNCDDNQNNNQDDDGDHGRIRGMVLWGGTMNSRPDKISGPIRYNLGKK